MHVDDDVHVERSRPVHQLGDPVEVGRVEPTALWLEQAPRDGEADRIETECCHRCQVGLAKWRVATGRRIRWTASICIFGRVDRVTVPGARSELEKRRGNRA